MKYTIVFAAVAVLFSAQAYAGLYPGQYVTTTSSQFHWIAANIYLRTKSIIYCIDSTLQDGKCVGKFRIRGEGSKDYHEIPNAVDTH
jgi:hypothetical protein